MLKRSYKRLIVCLSVVVFVAGCATNPVTGKRDFSIVGEDWELNVGKQAYSPYRQSQGGDYVVDPGVEAYVNQVGQRLAQVSDRKLPYEFNVLNSSVPNAWALPGGKIAINRGLLTELGSEAELAAVLGHEIVHAAARHGAKAQSRGTLLQGGVMLAGIAGGGGYGQLSQIGAQLVNQKYGRGAELESDEYGILYMSRAGYDPSAAVDLQKTFLRLSQGRQSSWLEGLFSSHPPSQERVSKNIESVRRLPPGGELNEQRYKQKIATLIKSKPAYEAYDKAYKVASKDKNYAQAKTLLSKAKKLEPREALFDLLEGDIDAEQGRYQRSLASYDRAINKNPDFFAPYSGRGAARYELGDRRGAKQDLEKSLKLLPGTPSAHYTLGRIAEDERDRPSAIKYYQSAAKSRSEIGKKSYVALLNLDLNKNPDKYIKARASQASSGELIVKLSNPAPVAITDISINIQIQYQQGRTDVIRRDLHSGLGAKKAVTLRTGVNAKTLKNARVKVISARLAN